MKKKADDLQLLELVMAEYPDIVLLLDHQGQILRSSQAAQKAYGYMAEDLSSMNLTDLQTLPLVARPETSGAIVIEEHRRKNGGVFCVEIKIRTFQLATDFYRLIIAREILAEPDHSAPINPEKSTTSNHGDIAFNCDATLNKRYEAIAAGIIVYDPNHQIIFANREMERILNCSWVEINENCLCETMWTFLDVDGNKIAPDSFPSSLSLATGQPFRHKVLGLKRTPADPVQWLMVHSIPAFDSAQVLTEVIVTIMDITTLRNAAEIFRENEKRMIFALESIHAGEWELNFQDFSVHYSPRSAEIFLGEECDDSRISPLNEVLDCFLDKDRERIQLSVLTAMKKKEAFDVTGESVARTELNGGSKLPEGHSRLQEKSRRYAVS